MYQTKQISKLSIMMILFISLVIFNDKTEANDKMTNKFYKAPLENKFTKRANSFVHKALLKGENGLAENNVFIIYFTDKNIFSDTELNLAIIDVNISERALQRRAKSFKRNHDLISFSDVSVSQTYIDRLGVSEENIRAKSKWFNFVSVKISVEKALLLVEKDFIYSMDVLPSASSISKSSNTQENIEIIKDGSREDPEYYGDAYDQVNQINCVEAHDAGYKGQGVLLMMMDTGFKKDHEVFDSLTIVAEHDFINDDGNVQNEAGDDPNQHNHGTACWSIATGHKPNTLVGPGFKADILLAKTEDLTQEDNIEEDWYVEALEWGEGLGADIVSASLGYTEFDDPNQNYTYEDMDGETAISTLGVKRASYLGVLCVPAAGNSGNDSWHYISAPSDADSCLTIGAVDSYGSIAGFSGYGPTYDGRIKPEVVALGVDNYHADAYSNNSYTGWGSGTSYAAPLVAGAAAVVLSAHPDWTNMQLKEALISTADRFDNMGGFDDTRYGYGLIDVMAAINYVQTDIGEDNYELSIINYQLKQNYPNPFNPVTKINYELRITNYEFAGIVVYNSAGQKVWSSPVTHYGSPVTGSISFDGSKFNSGIYYYSLIVDGKNLSTKAMVLIK